LLEDRASDAQLLERFLQGKDEVAFSALLRRYSPLVLHVGRRVLSGWHDAEDVFQATFLLLARKADTLRNRGSLASWLHGAAYRLAVQLRRQGAKRLRRERYATPGLAPGPEADAAWRELQAVLDEELTRLPDVYRAPLVLCCLEGHTQEEAARRLGWPPGTVSGRLHRARELLRQRLARRGLTTPALFLGVSFAVQAVAAAAPSALFNKTLTASLRYAAGERAAAVVPARAAALVEGALRTMKVKLTLALALVLVAGLCATVQGLGGGAPPGGPPPKPPRPPALAAAAAPDAPLPPGALRRLGSARLFPEDVAACSPFTSPDGKMIVHAARSGSVRVWSVADGRLLHQLPGEPGRSQPCFCAMCFTADSKGLFVASVCDGVVLRDLASGKVVRSYMRPDVRQQAVLAPSTDGKRLAAVLPNRSLLVWEVATGKKIGEAILPQAALGLASSPDGRLLAVTAGAVCLYDETGKKLRELPVPGGATGVAFSPDGKTVAGSGPRDEVILWDAATGKEKARGVCKLDGFPNWPWQRGLGFTPDGKRLAVRTAGRLSLWDVATAKRMPFPGQAGRGAWSLSHDGRLLIRVNDEDRLILTEALTGKRLHSFEGHDSAVRAIDFSPSGLLATGGGDGTIRLWDRATGKQLRVLPGRGSVVRVRFSPDGRLLATCEAPKTIGWPGEPVRLWDVATGKLLAELPVPGHARSLLFSPDGKQLTLTFSGPRAFIAAEVWDVVSRKKLREMPRVFDVTAISGDGKLLAHTDTRGRGDRVCVIDFSRGAEVRRMDAAPTALLGSAALETMGLAFTSDARRLVVARGSGQLALYDLSPGGLARALQPPGRPRRDPRQVCGPALRGDDRLAAISDRAGRLCVVELASGRPRVTLDSGQRAVTALAVSRDGRALATGGVDGTVLLWDFHALPAHGPAPKRAWTVKELERLWGDLLDTDAERAGRAVRALTLSPGQAVALLGKRLRAAPATDDAHLDRLIRDLGGDDFPTRERAEAELAKLGEAARGPLEAALKGKPSLELTLRVRGLLKGLNTHLPAGEEVRARRGVEVLEAVGTPEARKLLARLAAGPPNAVLTRDARAALTRLGR
jgi:RNA polymerase sigma factor (sigma-70 family)